MKKILYIGNKLSSHGNNVTSIETLGRLLEIEGFTLYYASSIKNIFFRMIDMMYKILKHSQEIDFVIIDTYSTKNFWYAVVTSQMSRIFKIKYIPILHGGDLPKRLVNNSFLSSLIFKNADVNVAPSKYLYKVFLEKGYSNSTFIPNTIEVEKYSFADKTFDYPRLLWVRSFSKIYNPILAVKVLIELKKKYHNATLCMIGPEKDESYKNTIQFAKDNNVEVLVTGKLSKKEWIDRSVNYNVFINTTHYDNMPVSVIEAIALGFPVVSTNVGGIPYLIEHTISGFLSPDDDVAAMVANIESIFDNENNAKTVIKTAYNLVEKFDWQIIKNEWFQLLK